MTQVNEMQTKRTGERGNVLFLILIAVALFAALSYAVTQSSRSGGGDASRETNLISGAQITQYPAGVRTTLVRMIIGNTEVNTLEFNSPSDFGNCTGAPATHGRCVFYPSPDGGGATYTLAPGDIMVSNTATPWIFNAENEINRVGISVGGDTPSAASADIIAFLVGVDTSVCERINEELGLGTSIPAETAIDVATEMINPDGATPTSIGAGGGTIGDDVAAFNGQPFGCFSQGGNNVYYHVLIER